MSVYYNEHDRFAAAWLRQLIAEGLIADGWVDERDIQQVQPQDLAGYDQCHFFAGIGGWAYALELAGWDGPVWTGSCPCQPFSAAGKGKGFDDTRHLWPTWFRLIQQCKPATVFGEQVASKDGLAWFDTVSTDLEAEGYSVGAADIAAAGVGAPQIRQRLWWVANTVTSGWEGFGWSGQDGTAQRGEVGGLGHSTSLGPNGRRWPKCSKQPALPSGSLANPEGQYGGLPVQQRRPLQASAESFWGGEVEWLQCRDGKARPTKPGLFPLASRVLNRVGTLRGAGNSICPQAAAEFIGAFMDVQGGR